MNIEDIRNPERRSGFDHVSSPKPGRWRAQAGRRPGSATEITNSWIGPYRLTPEEAAQDYVNMVNLGAAAPGGGRRVRTALRRAGHSRRRTLTPAERVARDIIRDNRAPEDRPGWVYLIGEHPRVLPGDYVKIGWTGAERAEARLADFQAGNPRRLFMLATLEGTKDLERELHVAFDAACALGEWFCATAPMLDRFGVGR